ncbi:hypothetical protein ND973_11370 [Vibrio diabolicus]|uniref:tetratricopeptide repeat protein n=1 Tax=Vibrio diabolicus TaxID=50719 RepID=UPI001112B0E9|nr:hypothetical protein [Vibrio diabolicus]MCR9473136.1 hypothetical protein [Vibrio diabolicus]MCS0327719.1 hypothetical protein [Vibrio diabolicus]TNC07904.1 hypothetical protein FHG74_13755 [Vibrio diabolicus]
MQKITRFTKSLLMFTMSVALSQGVWAQDKSLLNSDKVSPVEIPSQEEPMTLAQRVEKLSYDAQNKKLSSEKRIDALRELANYPSQNALVAVARGLKDADAGIREAAIVGAQPYMIEHRWRLVSPLLSDDDAMVRITAAINLVRDYANLSSEQQQSLEGAVTDLTSYLSQKTDNVSRLLLADVYRWHREWDKAALIYPELTKLMPSNPQVWLSYADNFRAQQKDRQAIQVLDEAITLFPDNAALHYSKSLALVRLGEKHDAASEIEKAANMAKNNSYFWYLNGVLQEELDLKKSVHAFEKAYLISGAPEQLYAVCDIYIRYDNPKSEQCLAELKKVAPDYVIDELNQKKGRQSTSEQVDAS